MSFFGFSVEVETSSKLSQDYFMTVVFFGVNSTSWSGSVSCQSMKTSVVEDHRVVKWSSVNVE